MISTTSAPLNTFPPIPGYFIVEQLYEGSRTEVYRAVQATPKRPVAIKLLQEDYPSFSELVQFRNQYAIAKNLNHPGIIRSYSLEPYGNRYALVMEDFGGISLQQYAQTHTLSLPQILSIALQLADILNELCEQHIVHKDLKPANILIHPDTQQVKLIDFSIASLLPKETREIQNPNVLEGTLAYLAPEQTGRMNRALDYRADFYSLGVTLYELLTSKLPFPSNNPLELVHCHIAKPPVPPHQINPILPPVVSAIVLKLMAKNAEDRYQSALGLKHDLEQCWHSWQKTGIITEFELGQRDLCDRFLVPEKLYGRESEVQTLLNAFERVTNSPESKQQGAEMMLVAGFSGIGKTAVVNEVHKPITRQHGYFIKGKFDQFNRNIPFSAFVQALRDLMGQLLSESDAQLTEWRTQILEAVGENGQVLIEVIPELERIIGQQPTVTELSGMAAQNRFNLLFQKFIGVLTTSKHPLVMFLDDLQWADSASLQLIKLLMEERGYLLLLGAYRDNEVSPVHPFILTVEELKKTGHSINTITLAPLAFHDTNRLVADTLHCSPARSQPLTELIVRKTQGNPFFTTQFLKALYADGNITFNRDQRYWECDLAQINALSLTEDVVEFMAQQLQKLPSKTQQVLRLAACIGNQFNLATLAVVSEQSQADAAAALWKALQEGLILPQNEIYKFYLSREESEAKTDLIENVQYRFLHDRVQQAAYSLIPEEDNRATHLKIGRLLLQETRCEELDERLFAIVNHLNRGIQAIAEANEREQLAKLNFKAGCKAKESTAYESAFNYFQMGLNGLEPDSWETQHDLTLALYEEGAEAAYLKGDFQVMEQWTAMVEASTDNLLERVKTYEVKIQAAIAQNKPLEAIEIAFTILENFGITFPKSPREEDVQKAFAELSAQLAGQLIESLLELPVMRDAYPLAAMRILLSCLSSTFIAAPALYPLIVVQQIKLSLQYGNSEVSAYIYGCYGLLLCSLVGDIESGYQFGQLALNLIERLNAKKLKARTWVVAYVTIHHWQQPLQSSLEHLSDAYRSGLETGDLEFAAIAAQSYCFQSYLAGRNLEATQIETEHYGRAIAEICRQQSAFYWTQIYQQTILNLQGKSDIPFHLQGSVYDLKKMKPLHQDANDLMALALGSLNQAVLCYLFEQYELALQNFADSETTLDALTSLAFAPIFYFYDSLTRIALLPEVSPSMQSEFSDRIAANQDKMKRWASSAPMNYAHKFELVEAERYRLQGKQLEALERYDRAIAGAKENGYLQEEALANELAAKFYLNWGKENVASGYMQDAYYDYAHWGAQAKTKDLEHRYPNLLRPILQQTAQALNPLETLVTFMAPNLSLHTSTSSSSSSSSSINTVLDFAALLKAAQSLSSTIQIDELLYQLTQTILQNSGGDRCVLVLPNGDGDWQVRAIATPETTVLCTEPLEGHANVPVKLIQYLKNTQNVVAIDDLKTDLPVIDEYLMKRHPKSLLGLPILNQGKLIGVLELKNKSTRGVFTNDRILILNFLCTQAAIALENARLYQQAQDYAQQLEQSQLQLIQSEKMSALGNLVAGVAHEINNPVGFIYGNVNEAINSLADITEYLQLYQEKFPEPGSEIVEKAEELDIEYQLEDLPKMLYSMKLGCDRIRNISTSLRTFSRADSDRPTLFNLHDGIDSTLLILKHRLKANNSRPAIEVIANYGDLPQVECFAGQLNQVFMNLLANAIDVFDETAQQSSFAELQAKPQKIVISTALSESNTVEIRIRDNGSGMSEEVKGRIFDHFFTTKGVGKGTGLGLAIAHQIVTQTHAGCLEVQSELNRGTEFCIRLPLSC